MNKTTLAVLGAAAALLLAACSSGGGSDDPTPPTPPTPPTSDDTCTDCQYHTLVWSDEFDGTGQPSATNWNYHVGNGWNAGIPGFQGWGNDEWEWYRPEQCSQQDGKLVIKADYFATATTIKGRDWYQRSCRITTQGKHAWGNARVEARIAMPAKAGTWPAFWMLGESNDATFTSNYDADLSYYDNMSGNWASCGEVDIMEHVNADTTTIQNLFWDYRTELLPWVSGGERSNPGSATVGDVTQFHTYAVEWNATTMSWFIDDVKVKTQDVSAANQEEFRKKFFVILNLAIDGRLVGTNVDPNRADFPLYMYVDYVRVYQ